MNKSEISVLKYIDYRLYLREYYTDRKKNQRGFSYRWFNQKAGFSSPVYLKLVMEGKRNLTKSSIAKFSLALHSKETKEYNRRIIKERYSKARLKSQWQEIFAVPV